MSFLMLSSYVIEFDSEVANSGPGSFQGEPDCSIKTNKSYVFEQVKRIACTFALMQSNVETDLIEWRRLKGSAKPNLGASPFSYCFRNSSGNMFVTK